MLGAFIVALSATARGEQRTVASADSLPGSIIHSAKTAFIVPDKMFFPEGLACDPVERSFYLGSTYKHKIVKINSDGHVKDFNVPEQDGLWEVLGLKVDAPRRALWACDAVEATDPAKDGYAAIFKYDLKTGKLIRKYAMDNKTGRHLFNDITVSAAGDVYFTDSRDGGVYTIDQTRDAIEVFLSPGTFDYPNGITLSGDERQLFVADSRGVTRITLKTKEPANLAAPPGEVIRAIDGMYWYKDSLLGIQAGPHGQRVVRLLLNSRLDNVTRVQVLDADNPLFDVPTTGCLAGDKFYFIGNSQMTKLKDDGTIAGPNALKEINILVLTLRPRA